MKNYSIGNNPTSLHVRNRVITLSCKYFHCSDALYFDLFMGNYPCIWMEGFGLSTPCTSDGIGVVPSKFVMFLRHSCICTLEYANPEIKPSRSKIRIGILVYGMVFCVLHTKAI